MTTWPADERRRDRGTTFVEILVSIVLLGTVVGGTLTALRTTIISSEVDSNQAKANAWLLGSRRESTKHRTNPCPSSDVAAVKSAYDSAVQTAPPPEGWAGGSIGVNIVYFWGKSDGREIWGDVCGTHANPPSSSRFTSGAQLARWGKTMRVVKDGR